MMYSKSKTIFRLAAATLFSLGAGLAQAQEITLTTEDYKPYNYMENEQIIGSGADQVFEIMKRSGIAYNAEMMQWSRAIGLGENQANTCVFTASHTDERNDKFKWVEPLFSDRTLLIRKIGSDVAPADLAAATSLSVGTQAKDYTEDLLKAAGFTNIDAANNFEQTLKKLEAGRVDLMAVSEPYFKQLVAGGAQVEEALELSSSTLSLACSKSTDDALIAKMQAALDSMIADGTQAEILAKYK
jgi:polar amino acid transport system substrate-binding protein